jgi:hypothetical protein
MRTKNKWSILFVYIWRQQHAWLIRHVLLVSHPVQMRRSGSFIYIQTASSAWNDFQPYNLYYMIKSLAEWSTLHRNGGGDSWMSAT